MDHDSEPHNEPVAKTIMTLTMLHPASMEPASMSQIDIANHLAGGEFLGVRNAIETTMVADEDVDGEVEAMGGAPGLYAAKGPFIRSGHSRG